MHSRVVVGAGGKLAGRFFKNEADMLIRKAIKNVELMAETIV